MFLPGELYKQVYQIAGKISIGGLTPQTSRSLLVFNLSNFYRLVKLRLLYTLYFLKLVVITVLTEKGGIVFSEKPCLTPADCRW